MELGQEGFQGMAKELVQGRSCVEGDPLEQERDVGSSIQLISYTNVSPPEKG